MNDEEQKDTEEKDEEIQLPPLGVTVTEEIDTSEKNGN